MTGSNDAPVVSAAVVATVDEDDANPATINLLANASDPDRTDDVDSAALTVAVTDGTWAPAVVYSVDNETGALTFDPNQFNALGVSESIELTFSYNVVDGEGGVTPTTAVVTITGSNDAPVVSAAVVATVDEDDANPATINLLANASDPDRTDDVDSAALTVAVTDGTWAPAVVYSVDNETGALTFDPNQFNALGVSESIELTFSYNVVDGEGGVTPTTAVVTITGSNDAPTVTAGAQSVQLVEAGVAQPGTASASITLTKTDPDSGDTAVYDATALTTNGWATSNGGVTYTRTGSYGTATLTTASGVLSYALDNNDTDTNALAQGASVSDNFTVYVNDGSTGTASTVVNFAITGTNDNPTVTAGAQSVQLVETGVATVGTASASITLTKVDPDTGDSAVYDNTAMTTTGGWATGDGGVTYTKTGIYGTATLTTATGVVSYALNNVDPDTDALAGGVIVADNFTAYVKDGSTGTASTAVSFRITGTNDAPVVSGLTVTETAISFVATDPDNAGLSLSSPFGATFGNPTITSGATTTLTPSVQASAVSGTLQVTDGSVTAAVVGLYLGTGGNDSATAPLATAPNAMYGFDGDDTLTGGSAADRIFGGANNDTIVGGGGADLLVGGSGNDTMSYEAGATINGDATSAAAGTDGDTLVLTQAVNINLSLANQDTSTVSTVAGFENVDASTLLSAVTLTGSSGANILKGGSGADTLTGGGGADTLTGGAGNDTYVYGSTPEAAAGEIIVEAVSGGTDTIRTTAIADLSALTVNGAADLQGASSLGIEQILIAAGSSVTFSGAQLTGNTIAINESTTGTTNLVINVASGATNTFANLTFAAFAGGDAFDNGTDTITINGAAGAENITGTSFADTITGQAGNDTLIGGAGNDTYIFGLSDGVDTITDSNTDTIVISASGAELTGLNILDSSTAFDTGNLVITFNGQQVSYANFFVGTNNINISFSNATFVGYQFGSGNYLVSQDEADPMLGTAGNDIIAGVTESDLMDGGDGNDILFGNGATIAGTFDNLSGGNGNDLLISANANDQLNGGNDDDVLIGAGGADTLTGGAGNDTYVYGSTAEAAAGENIVEAVSGGTDTIRTTATADLSALTVNGAADLQGASSLGVEQILIAGGSIATFTGAQLTGNTIVINESTAGTTNLVINVASGATNTFANLTFAAFAGGDAFDDGADAITINGAGGAENITGTSLADNISGGAGADTLTGGAGNDTYSYASTGEAAAGENIVEAINGGTDTIRTTATADLSALTVNGSADLQGAGASQGIEQILIASGTTATFSGAQLNGNTIAVNESAAGTTNLVINVASGATNSFANLTFAAFTGGDAFDDGVDTITINGAGGSENITGTNFADAIIGGGGADTINGGGGGDLIAGGTGNDNLTGGAGDDQFRLRTDGNLDTITDYTDGNDKIGLLGGAVTGGFTFGNTVASPSGTTLASADLTTRASITGATGIDAGNDDNQVIVITGSQTATQIQNGTASVGGGSADNLYVAVFNSTTGKGEIWFDSNWNNASGRTQVATLDNVTTLAGISALTNADFVVYNGSVAPAGIAGSPINLGLTDPVAGHLGDIAVTIDGIPSGWTVSGGTENGNGNWTMVTNNVASLSITSAANYSGALVVNVKVTWTNIDGSSETAIVADNVEVYAAGNPIFAISGDDNLTGSSGHDLFVFAQPIGHDVIYSFDIASDQIDLIGYADFTGFGDIQAHMTDNAAGDAVITLADGQSITLKGVAAASLDASDFVFDQTPVTENAGNMVISDGAILPLSGIINNTGTIELNSTGSETDLQLIQHGITLQGGGHVGMSDSVGNVISGTVSDVTLTNVDNIIEGAGQIGAGQLILINEGTIIASGTNTLEIDTGSNIIINVGTLEATGSGGLVIESNVENSGQLWAHGGDITVHGDVTGNGTALIDGVATIEFAGASSTNVTIDADATGTLRLGDSFDFSGLVSGFNADDHFDLDDIVFGSNTSVSYVENEAGNGGTLSVTDGVHAANLGLLGQYSADGFTLASDDISGTLVSYRDQLHI
ncbi:VCBS domain-containing protein [Bradyrhizobium sp. AUGA SZCCT0177]|uniref:VCBS domain-containing protein n=1 Tax=Bradyrhizobium sp. AUGA SZCCT0177 TaxID=2807665 RepID=UPI0032E045BF